MISIGLFGQRHGTVGEGIDSRQISVQLLHEEVVFIAPRRGDDTVRELGVVVIAAYKQTERNG